VLYRVRGSKWARLVWVLAGLGGIVCAGILVAAAVPDQPAGDAVGLIEGGDIAVTGPMSVEVVGGQTKTILRSGSDVRVKSGRARISLAEGGQISICGPAHFSVLKSGGSLTLALESGAIHARMEREPALTVYTPQIQAQPVAIGEEPRDFLVGFENPGMMCVRAYRGAMRLEQQLSGQNVMVPQGGDVMLTNGQIETLQNGAGHCNCELQIARAPQAPPASVAPAVTTGESAKNEVASYAGDTSVLAGDQKPEAKTEPIYTVVMPPLRFDASAKVQPAPDPKLMVIVRRVRVRPTLIFQGRVEEEPMTTEVVTPSQPPVATAPANAPPATPGSVVDRVRTFFRRLWTRSS
jgi:hypothetical protein